MSVLNHLTRVLRDAAKRAGIGLLTVVMTVNGTLLAYVPVAKADLVSGANALASHFDYFVDPIEQEMTPVFERPEGSRNGANPFGYDGPVDVTYESGIMHVVDSGNNRILRYGLAGDGLPNGVIGQEDFHGSDTGAASSLFLEEPKRIFSDPSLGYLVSTGNQIRIYTGFEAAGVEPAEVVGTEEPGAGAGSFNGVGGIGRSEASDLLFVADTFNSRVLVFDALTFGEGATAVQVLGQPDFASTNPGLAANRMAAPTGVWVDTVTDRLYVADSGNNRVLIWDVDDATTDSDALRVLGQPDFTSSDPATTQSGLSNPTGLAVQEDNSDWLYVADTGNNRVVRYDVDGLPADGQNADAVIGQPDFTSNGVSTTATSLSEPTGVQASSGLVTVADTGNNRIMFWGEADINTEGSGIPAVQVIGQYDASIVDPFVMWETNSPVMFTKGLENAQPLRGSSIGEDARALAWNPALDRVYMADGPRVLVFDATETGGLLSDIPTNVLGQPSFNQYEPASGAAGIGSANSVTYDTVNGLLWVADLGNHRLLAYDDTAIINGEDAVIVLGQPDFDTVNFGSGAGELNRPVSVVADNDGERLYVADRNNNRVLSYDLNGVATGDSAEFVLGQAGFGLGDAGSSMSGMSQPYGVDYGDGKLFVADAGNNRVLVFALPLTNGEAAVNYLGSDDTETTEDSLSFPTDVEYDPSTGQLFVSDVGNGRVLEFDGLNIDDANDAKHVIGQPDFFSNETGYSALQFDDAITISHLDGTEILYVHDGDSPRMLEFDSFFEYVEGVDPEDPEDPEDTEEPEEPTGPCGPGSETCMNKVLLTREKAAEPSKFYASFILSEEASTTLVVTFPPEFTVTGPATGAESSDCLSNFGFSATTLTADKDACEGGVVLGGATVINPEDPGQYNITWENDQPGFGAVYIVDDDQVEVTASVSPKITFDIDVGVDGTEGAPGGPAPSDAPYEVAMGALAIADVRVSGAADGVNRIMLDLSTNATGGAVVTVQSQNGPAGLASLSTPADGINSADGTMAPGTENYGLCVISVTEGNGLLSIAGDYVGLDCAPDAEDNDVVGLATSPEPIVATAGPLTLGRVEIAVNAAIGTETAAHSDYQDVLTFIASGTY